jgi:hypothetical protein
MSPRIVLSALAALAVLAATPGGAQPASTPSAKHHHRARPKPTNLRTSPDLWATINVCDTATHPNTIGIRGSMPGLGNRSARLEIRYRVQYKAKTDGQWHATAGAVGDSGWNNLGRTRREVIESGRNFAFAPPTDGGSHLLRGDVRFRWKRHGHVVARRRRFTDPGHPTTVGADPKRYSAAECEITQP